MLSCPSLVRRRDEVPVVMDDSNRPFLARMSSEDILSDDPTTCIQGD